MLSAPPVISSVGFELIHEARHHAPFHGEVLRHRLDAGERERIRGVPILWCDDDAA